MLHGENDWLLPPTATLQAAATCKSPHRVWFLRGVGHAPQSLEVNDREYRGPLVAVFDEAFQTGTSKRPPLSIQSVPAGEHFVSEVLVHCEKPIAAQIAIADAQGQLAFFNRLLVRGKNEFRLTTRFRPNHASLVAFQFSKPDGDAWSAALSDFWQARQEFLAFERDAYRLLGDDPGPSAAAIRELLSRRPPEPDGVPTRIRARYAPVLARLCTPLFGSDRQEADRLAARLVEFLPSDPT